MRYFFLFCGILVLTSCSHNLYQVAEVKSVTEKHTTIAVFQPKVEYLFAKPEKKFWSRVPQREVIAKGFQVGLVNWIGKRQVDEGVEFVVIDQEIANQIFTEDPAITYDELALKLGVDAVLVSRLKYDARHDYSPDFFRYNNDALLRSRIYLNLFTPKEGLIWSYENVGHRSFESYDRLVRELVRPAAGNFPYLIAK